jgi:xanthine/uracil/vitamin C permease (AzgA family)
VVVFLVPDFDALDTAIPAFLILLMTALTFSIS